MRASQQARTNIADLTAQLTRSAVDPAFILPTRDPRKPWGTRTPRPTSTPRLILTATPTPAGPATPMPTNVSAPGRVPGIPGTPSTDTSAHSHGRPATRDAPADCGIIGPTRCSWRLTSHLNVTGAGYLWTPNVK